MNQLCQNCHAEVSAAANRSACPACGGALIAHPSPDPGPALDSVLDPLGTPLRPVDHRGILLPNRHAVGGIITPR